MQQSKLGGNVNIKKITKYQWACVFDTNLHADGAHGQKRRPGRSSGRTLIRHLNAIQYSSANQWPTWRIPAQKSNSQIQSDDQSVFQSQQRPLEHNPPPDDLEPNISEVASSARYGRVPEREEPFTCSMGIDRSIDIFT
jgi:hypothetical protein